MPKLPEAVLRKRLQNEVAQAMRKTNHSIMVKDRSFSEWPSVIDIIMKNAPGPVKRGERVTTKYTHKFRITITREYPYQKPIVEWQSEIFHPNIMEPFDGGYVCTKLLERWTAQDNLSKFIIGIESLLANPNASDPYGTCSCKEAALYFRDHGFRPGKLSAPPAPKVRIIGEVGG
jgi:ubiquitin-protein ligase